MSSTRFYDDEARIKKRTEESLNAGGYYLDVPGNGLKPNYMEDPHIRLQKWGANIMTNTMDIEEDLRGLNRKLKRDQEEYINKKATTIKQVYGTDESFVDETRSSIPAWTFRDKERTRWDYSHHKSQDHVEIPFDTKKSTRIEQKSKYENI